MVDPVQKTPIEKWYKDGLRFECIKCGACCNNGGIGGIVVHIPLTLKELLKVSDFLNLKVQEFVDRYCGRLNGMLTFRCEDGTCPLLVNNECSVHPARFFICRAWPFLPQMVQTEDTWNDPTPPVCPGLNKGPLHTAEKIDRVVSWIERTRSKVIGVQSEVWKATSC